MCSHLLYHCFLGFGIRSELERKTNGCSKKLKGKVYGEFSASPVYSFYS